jgi:antitoxin component of MazEF toxin-antitoxin module
VGRYEKSTRRAGALEVEFFQKGVFIMSVVTAHNETSAAIIVPLDELEKAEIAIGDNVELTINEGEIILRRKKNERTQRVLEKTREIIERRRSALVELGKGSGVAGFN